MVPTGAPEGTSSSSGGGGRSGGGEKRGMDNMIRQITAGQAVERTTQLWQDLRQRSDADGPLLQSTYIEVLRYTARRILVKLEETSFDSDTWKSYTDFFLQAMLAYGTADVKSYLCVVERLLNAVLAFPTEPEPLLKEYLHCAVAQSTQRSAELAAYIAKNPTGETPALEQTPDLEYDGGFVACIVARPVTEVMRVLECLPPQMTFAHHRGIVHLKLCNPLRIPGCAFVSTGYGCDTCHLRGIRVGFQAMVYDAEESTSSTNATDRNVRSDAQICRKMNYGFDVCMACAVAFYAEQREALLALLHAPHHPFVFGRAAGVRIAAARHHHRRVSMTRPTSSMLPAFLTAGSRPLSCPTSGRSSATDTKESSGYLSEPGGGGFSIGSSGSEDGPARGRVLRHRLPTRPPGRRSSDSGTFTSTPPEPPATRCVEGGGCVVSVTAAIAPFGARPIAWVLSHSDTHVGLQRMDDVLRTRLGPHSDWRARVVARRKSRTPSCVAFASPAMTSSAPQKADPTSSNVAATGALSAGAVAGRLPRVLCTSRHAAGVDEEEEEEMCAICLCPLSTDAPVVETSCHHWFHVSCIEEHASTAEDVCPLCRAVNVLPDMSRAKALATNIYQLEVTLTEEEVGRSYVDVCVGSIVTRDGNYRDATSIAAAQTVRLYPGQLWSFEQVPPSAVP